MVPIVNLQQFYPGLFSYGIGMTGKQMYLCEDDFNSGARCVRDAGAVLLGTFEAVQICYAGFALGAYQVARLVKEPATVFDELMASVRTTYRAVPKVWQRAEQAAAAPLDRCECVPQGAPHPFPALA